MVSFLDLFGSDSILVMVMAGTDDEVFPFELKVSPDFHYPSSFQLHFNCKGTYLYRTCNMEQGSIFPPWVCWRKLAAPLNKVYLQTKRTKYVLMEHTYNILSCGYWFYCEFYCIFAHYGVLCSHVLWFVKHQRLWALKMSFNHTENSKIEQKMMKIQCNLLYKSGSTCPGCSID